MHLQFLWMLPLTDQVPGRLGSRTIVLYRATGGRDRSTPEDIADLPPFTSVSISSVTVTE